MSRVESIMTRAVVCVKADDSVQDVERLMEKMSTHLLPVIDDALKCIGVISAIDLVHFHNIRKRASEVMASEICSQPAVTVKPNLSVVGAMELMVSNNLHHLIVLENDGLIGIVSSMDILEKYLLKASC